MKTSIWPETWGDRIVALKYTPTGVAQKLVNKDGSDRQPFSWVTEIRDGGGHDELAIGLLDAEAGFDLTDQHPTIHT